MAWFKHNRSAQHIRVRLQRVRAIAAAAALTLTGAVVTLSPLPFGAPLMAGGLALMSTVDRTCRRAMIGARKKSKLFNKIICKSGSVLPTRARKIIGLTDPQTYKPDPEAKEKER